MSKFSRFSLAEIDAPLKTLTNSQVHAFHGRRVCVMSVNKAQIAKCIPLGWDDDSISTWGFNVPEMMLKLLMDPNADQRILESIFGKNAGISISEAVKACKAAGLVHFVNVVSEVVEGGDPDVHQTLFVNKWSVLGHYNINGKLLKTTHQEAAKPVPRGSAILRTIH